MKSLFINFPAAQTLSFFCIILIIILIFDEKFSCLGETE